MSEFKAEEGEFEAGTSDGKAEMCKSSICGNTKQVTKYDQLVGDEYVYYAAKQKSAKAMQNENCVRPNGAKNLAEMNEFVGNEFKAKLGDDEGVVNPHSGGLTDQFWAALGDDDRVAGHALPVRRTRKPKTV
eukprot:10519921-Alexandrium_andersonii.AAC.1